MAESKLELIPVRCGCGSEAVIYVTHWWGKCYVCECEECGTASRPCTTEAEAVEAWNRAMSGGVAKNATTERSAQECAENARCKEPERKKGEWLEKKAFDNADYEISEWQEAKCSVCGKYHTTPYLYNFSTFAYCPSCGAEMTRGVADGTKRTNRTNR